MKKTSLAILAVVAIATPALAAEFYVVQDTSTKRCTIVEQKPTSTTMVVVGDGKVYATRAEADAAVKTIAVCKTN
jgi:vancomycin permeability regulator SanA